MKSFDSLRWEARILILSVPDKSDESLLQIEYLENAKDGLFDRDIIVVLDNGNEAQVVKELSAFEYQLPHDYVSEAEELSLTLIGKDGGVKKVWMYGNIPVSAEEIFSIIDSMPMRLNEMKQKNDK